MLNLLQLEAETGTASPRERELDTGRLVLRAAAGPDGFTVRRARHAVAALEASPARRALGRTAAGLAVGDAAAVESGLLGYGTVLEQHGEFDAAVEVYEAVAAARPDEPVLRLHTARAARKAGRRARALELYRSVGSGCGCDARLRRLVRIGEALVADVPVAALDEMVRESRRGRDAEALAVAFEERARLHHAAGRFDRAIRDLGIAALRFPGRTDRVRALHRLAELLSARGDLPAAREALLAASDHVDDRHREHTLTRLRTLARAMGDQLELRRTRGRGGKLVMLAPASRRPAPGRSWLPRIRRLRDALPPLAGC